MNSSVFTSVYQCNDYAKRKEEEKVWKVSGDGKTILSKSHLYIMHNNKYTYLEHRKNGFDKVSKNFYILNLVIANSVRCIY